MRRRAGRAGEAQAGLQRRLLAAGRHVHPACTLPTAPVAIPCPTHLSAVLHQAAVHDALAVDGHEAINALLAHVGRRGALARQAAGVRA